MNVRTRSRWLSRRSSVRRCLAAGLTVGSVASVAAPPTPSVAYPQDPNNCNDDDISWHFGDPTDSLWNDDGVDRQVFVVNAISTLNDALDHDGTQLQGISSGGEVSVSIRSEPDGKYGKSECDLGNATLWINHAYTDGETSANIARFFWQVSRHEMFHLAGAEHAGNDDSHDGDNPPTMATCTNWWTFRNENSLAQDDAAYLNWLHGGLANRQLHANVGFEQGTNLYWGQVGGTLTYKSSGGATGVGLAIWKPINIGDELPDYLYQTVTLHTGDDNESYRGMINARELNGSYKSKAKVELRWRPIAHQATSDCKDGETPYPDGIVNPNGYTVPSSTWLLMSGTGWQDIDTSWGLIDSAWENPATADGMELQIRAHGYSLDGSSVVQPMALDNVRGEGT